MQPYCLSLLFFEDRCGGGYIVRTKQTLLLMAAVAVLACSEQRPALQEVQLTLVRYAPEVRPVLSGSQTGGADGGESLSLGVRLSGPRPEEMYLVHDESELVWRFESDDLERAKLDDADAAYTHVFDGIVPPAGSGELPDGQYRVLLYGRDQAAVEQRAPLRVPPAAERRELDMPQLVALDGRVELSFPTGTERILVRAYDEEGRFVAAVPVEDGEMDEADIEELVELGSKVGADRRSAAGSLLVFAHMADSDLVLVGPGRVPEP